ncbi:hypothetical protein MKW94_007164 [Papaver nudicaule]|uniref:C2H2-type domain-containing protein n=1 Tax=Papaver nudicaule TaxID=74823 RepID=A0AA41VZB7_PAPNU|nr:hypothetical protein [Papaver nudicaule]
MEDDQEKQFEFLENHHGAHLDDGTALSMKKNRILKIKLKSNSNASKKEYGDEEKESRVYDVSNKNFSSRKDSRVHMRLDDDLGSQQSQYHQLNYFNKQEEHEEENDYGSNSDNDDVVMWQRIKDQNKCSSTELMMAKNHKHHQQIFIDVSAAASAASATVNSNYNNLSSDNSNNNDNTCRVCGKTFPSRKSLFGHMRCHPEREWRGIEPPTAAMIAKGKNYTNSSSTISSDSREEQKLDDRMVIDSSREYATPERKMKPSASTPSWSSNSGLVDIDLPKWSVTAKRGRRSFTDSKELKSNKMNVAVDYSDEKEQKNPDDECVTPADRGAYDLMMLVMAAAQSESTTPPDSSALQSTIEQRRNDKSNQDDCSNNYNYSEVEEEGSNCKGGMKTGDYPRGGLSSKKKRKKRFKVHNKESEIGYIYDRTSKVIMEDSDVEYGDEKLSEMMMGKKRKTMKLKDLAKVVDDGGDDNRKQNMKFSTADRFKCTICNKSFPSHQALGGHRSSHGSTKINQPKHKSNIEVLAAGGLTIRREADEDEEEGYHFYGLVNNDNANIKRTHEDFGVQRVESISNSQSKLMSGAMTRSSNNSMQTHRCSICGKTFPTGQALGGHKRHHGTSPSTSAVVDRTPPPPSSSSSVGSAEDFSKSSISTNTTAITTNSITTATADGGHRVVFDFDLNELPVMEE